MKVESSITREELKVVDEWLIHCKQNRILDCAFAPCSECEKIMGKLYSELEL